MAFNSRVRHVSSFSSGIPRKLITEKICRNAEKLNRLKLQNLKLFICLEQHLLNKNIPFFESSPLEGYQCYEVNPQKKVDTTFDLLVGQSTAKNIHIIGQNYAKISC